jgi:hypothetical protein
MKEIEHINYVVQRNWEGDEEHPDLDLFVSNDDYLELRRLLPDADIRTPGDRYYPPFIERILLKDRRKYGDWWIPSKQAAFLALYWHANLHKGPDHKYNEKLRNMFFDWLKPLKAIDKGVGYHGPDISAE